MRIVTAILLFMSFATFARVGEEPPSLRYNNLNLSSMESYQLDSVNVKTLLDKHKPVDFQTKPVVFAIPNTVEITTKTHGKWTAVPDGKVWQLRFQSKGATDVNFGFTEFHLPVGAQLYILSFADNPVFYDGPYTSDDNRDYKQFWSAPVPGGDVAIELFVPDYTNEDVTLKLTKVSTGFRDVFKRYGGDGLFPKQGSCNNDVICPEGDPWRDEIRSVAAYTLNGADTCSGTMVMDAERSFKPYFLTAAHCSVTSSNAASMVTIWNYESPNCGDLSGGSRLDTVSGAIFKARRTNVDVGLVELASTPPEEYGVYWAGWDSSGATPSGSVGIHHPGVDEKAISFNNDALTTVNSCIGSGGVNTHWEVDNWEDGTTEPGSSGSGLWDPETHLVVGFLSGGLASCTNIDYDCYGKVSEAWDDGTSGAAGNLKPWLDPTNTGVTFIQGSDPNPFSLTSDDTTISVCNGDTSVGSILNVVTNGVFTGPVTLSHPVTPAFISNFAFTTNPVNPTPGSTPYSFDVGAGTTGSHTLTLQGDGIDAGNPVTTSVDVQILYSSGTTSATNLNSPANGASNVSLSATFNWDADANATTYRIQIATDAGFSNIVVDEVVETNSYQASDLPSSSQLYWRVDTQSSCNGDAVWSATYNFTTTALPGDCVIGYVPVSYHTSDFESGEQGWTHSALVGQDGWSLSGTNPHSGVQAMHGAPFTSDNDTVLVSPPISLPLNRSPLTMQFWNRQEMEDRSATSCWDGGILEISTDGGSNYTQVPNEAMFSDPYDGELSAGPLSGSDAWCGDPQEYLNSIVDIDSYSGQTVQFRFRKSNDGSVGHGGWDIDDVRVIGCDTDLIFDDGFEPPEPPPSNP